MENIKTKKKKPTYSLFSNLKFTLKDMWKLQKGLIIFTLLSSPIMVIAPFLGIYLSKEVITAVTRQKSPGEVLVLIAAVSSALLAANITNKYFNGKIHEFRMAYDMKYQVIMLDKCVKSDYENMESLAGLTRVSKAFDQAGTDRSAMRLFAYLLPSLTANIIGIISYAAILIKLSLLILLAVTATTVSGFFILKMAASWDYRNKDKWKIYDRKIEYLNSNSGDFTKAKDMRLYNMTEWFGKVFKSTLSDRMKWHKKEQIFGFGTDGLQLFLSLIRECISYGFLAYLILANNLNVADFVMYFGIIGGFSGWVNGIVQDFDNINRFHLGCTEMREFLDYPDKANHGEGIPLPEDTFSIEFKNVSYRYSGNREDTIKNLSFEISKGEKLAIVGLNGAGKTTLVKLMCGLYTPSEGEILINGQSLNAYNREEYYTLLSVVFQDIFVIPLSIAKNITTAAESETDNEKLQNVIALAGLSDKINSLPDGIETKLVKSIYENAIDLSGGEMQKLALARALYKNGKTLILDEPTAALDPIAESNIYKEYNRMTSGRTSVFISHRLASTRFCDRIFFLENGKIIEYGNHEKLMEQKGKYFEMFEIQSHYYKEGVKENDIA